MKPITFNMLPFLVEKPLVDSEGNQVMIVRSSWGFYFLLSNNAELDGIYPYEIREKHKDKYKYSWAFANDSDIEELSNSEVFIKYGEL